MSEFARLLRYAIPGGVFELLLAVGLLLIAYPDYTMWVKDIGLSGQALVTLLVADAFPLGFLISVIANEIAWFWHKARQWKIWSRVYFWRDAKICQPRLWGRISTCRAISIVAAEYPHRIWLRRVCADMGDRYKDESIQAFVEVALRFSHGGESYRDASQRLRSMADLMNGMINSAVAVILAFLAFLVVCVCLHYSVNGVSVTTCVLFLVMHVVLFACIWMAERRLARIAEAFAIGMIRARWR